jgi:2-methylcitrate dehydratase PrpD
MNTTVSHAIADFIVQTGYPDIPAAIIQKAKECLLDIIGVTLYGSKFRASHIAWAMIENSGSFEGKATILGKGIKASPAFAAFVNGVMSHVADFDDTLLQFKGHSSCVLMPTVLALCESSGRGGRELLTAFVVGTEVSGKLGEAMGWEHYHAGWHATGTVGSIGAAAAASKALNLCREKIGNAIGIAASCASGVRENFGTMTKSFHAGHAAMAGVFAAQLAEKGFESSPTVLEGNAGFAKLFGASDQFASLAKNFGIVNALDKIMLKPYPSCAGTHTAVDAILKIRNEILFDLEEIVEIEVRGLPVLSTVLIHHNPQTSLEAKFSMEFCVSAAFIFGQLGISQFEEKPIFDSRVRHLMGKVKVIPDNEMEEASRKQEVLSPVRLMVKLRDGREISETVWEAKGSPSHPMSRDEIVNKFRECAENTISPSNIEDTLKTLDELESLKTISELTSLLVSP